MRTIKLLLLFQTLLLGLFLTMGTMPAYAVDDIGAFELDGNAIEDTAGPPPDDWETLCVPSIIPGGPCLNLGDPTDPPPAASGADIWTGVTVDPDQASIFTGGRKDIQFISQWSHKDGAVPDKSDITNAYAAAYSLTAAQAATVQAAGHLDWVEGQLILYFGADRFSNVGDTFMGFWFFKQEVVAEADGSFSGEHENGDTLVLVNFPQASNAVPLIQVVEWDDSCSKADNNNPAPGDCAAQNLRLVFGQSGAGAVCSPLDNPGDQPACAITNSGTVDAPWSYTSKDGFVNQFPFETFFEGGINLSLLVPGDGCFASFMAETRSSSSFTASLKDFVLDAFPLCGIDVTKVCPDGETSIVNGTDLEVNFEGEVINTGVADLYVTMDDLVAGGALTPAVTLTVFDETNTQVVTGTAPINFTIPGGETWTYTGTFTILNTSVTQVSDEVSVEARLDAADIDPIDSATASDECVSEPTASLASTKTCTAALNGAGNALVISYSGTVTNTGDVRITALAVSDDTDGAVDTLDKTTLLPGEVANYSGQFTTTSNLVVSGSNPYTIAHTDTVSADGIPAIIGGVVVAPDVSATCDVLVDAAISVSKACEVDIQSETFDVVGVGLVSRLTIQTSATGQVCNTGDLELTGVTLTDSDIGAVSLVDTTLSPAECVDYDFIHFPSSFIPGTVNGAPASEAHFQDSVSTSGTPALVGGAVTANNLTDPAECYLCDSDRDGEPDIIDETPIPNG